MTYSGEGVFISLGLICSTTSTTPESLADNFRSAIYAYSKIALYGAVSSSSGSAPTVNAALYVVAKAWYRSIAVSSSVVLADSLNNFAQPARPQTLEDVFNGPYFVQKVSTSSSLGAQQYCQALQIWQHIGYLLVKEALYLRWHLACCSIGFWVELIWMHAHIMLHPFVKARILTDKETVGPTLLCCASGG